MEADWEFEIGGDSPAIDAGWSGFVDLREDPERISSLAEVAALPSFADLLVGLNRNGSPMWTAKCDFFPSLTEDEFDASELDASAEDARYAVACYVDLLPAVTETWRRPEQVAEACVRICSRLHAAVLSNCRADLVIRRAVAPDPVIEFAVTAYITACGATSEAARAVMAKAMRIFSDAVVSAGNPDDRQSS